MVQGTPALNTVAEHGFKYSRRVGASQWVNALVGGFIGFVVTGTLFAPLIGMAFVQDNPGMSDHSCAVLYAWLCAAGAAITLGVLALGPLGAIRRARKQGFYNDILPEIVAQAASRCWLLCDSSMQIVEATEAGMASRTVYYDAIGAARVVYDKTDERVEITGREGLVMATISWPTGNATMNAYDLAAALAKKAAATRKAT